jgi:aminopeptidase N
MMWLSDYAGPGYGVQTYSKAEISLNALGGIVGDSAVIRAFADYAKAWKYKHPTPYDFFFSMNKSLGKNLDWFWYQWYFTTYTTDQAIESVVIATRGDGVTVTIRDKGDMAMPIILNFEMTDGQSTLLKVPADVWFSGKRTYVARIPLMGKTLKSVTLDPENRFQDLDTTNNVWRQS